MLDKKQLAEYFNISIRTVERMMDYGMPYYKTSSDNGAIRFDLDEVKEWMRKNAKK